jgi:hypothetical protein
VYQTKLVGLVISSNLSWGPHVEYTVENAKLWLLVRFKNREEKQEQLLTLYQLKIRSIAEFAAPAFHGALTAKQSNELEMVQQKAFAIILGDRYKSSNRYSNALALLGQDTLSSRRLKLCENFSQNCVKSDKHADLFPRNEGPKTRHSKTFIEPKCKTSRYYNSAVPYLTRLLNKKEN